MVEHPRDHVEAHVHLALLQALGLAVEDAQSMVPMRAKITTAAPANTSPGGSTRTCPPQPDSASARFSRT